MPPDPHGPTAACCRLGVRGAYAPEPICTSSQTTTPTSHGPTTQFFTGRMPFLPPNQQRQSTEGSANDYQNLLMCDEVIVYEIHVIFLDTVYMFTRKLDSAHSL